VGSISRSEAAGAIVAAGRRLGSRGLISAGEGNISVRLDHDRLLVTPAGRRKDELTPADLVVVWLDHDGPETPPDDGRRPTSDLAIHRAIHTARRDVLAVVHAHLPASMALTLAGELPDPGLLPETAVLLPRLPLVALATPGSLELAEAIAAALTEPPEPFATAVLLERHGAVAVGADPAQAVDRLELVEVLCRTWRDAILIRLARSSPAIVSSVSPGSSSEGA
jgi:L-fuculose-phosphate aldolase